MIFNIINFAFYISTLLQPLEAPRENILTELNGGINAKSAIVYDLSNNEFLYKKNSNKRRYIGSLTKLMTATIVLSAFNHDEEITVKRTADAAGGSTIGLYKGDQLEFEDLLSALLIPSANDAAYAFADNYPQGLDGFVEAMNNIARFYGMNSTHFTNITGVDNVGHYSTTNDLLILVRHIWTNPLIKKITGTKEKIIETENHNWYTLKNTNKLLFYDGFDVVGLKTGTTEDAGACLIAITNIKDKQVVMIFLNSSARFADAHFVINTLMKLWNK